MSFPKEQEVCICLFLPMSAGQGHGSSQGVYLLHLTISSGMMTMCQTSAMAKGWRYYRQGWMTELVLLLPLTDPYHSPQREFQEFLGQITGKLLWLLSAFSNMLYQPMEEHVIFMAVFHQGMPHCQWGKAVWCQLKYIFQINGWGSALPNTTAIIFFFHCTLDWHNSKELLFQLLQGLN